MNIKPIRNEADYQKALKRLEQIFDAKRMGDAITNCDNIPCKTT